MDIADVDRSTNTEDVGEAVRGFFYPGSKLEPKVSLTKRSFRGNKKAYVLVEDTWARNYSR